MQVRQLGDRVADALVDRAGDLAALQVGDAHVHAQRGLGDGQRLVAVGDDQHPVRPLPLDHRLHRQHAAAGGARHPGQAAVAIEIIQLVRHREAVGRQHLAVVAVAGVEQRAADHRGEFEVGAAGDGAHGRLHLGVVAAGGERDQHPASRHE
jgi:hypothetical protein